MKNLRARALALALVTGSMTTIAAPSHAQVFIGVQVRIAPPPLPVYVQPPLPGPDYIWTPGYWAWDDDYGDYYWVPGTWVEAPRPGYLWTPGYWGWSDGLYIFHAGYWGPHIGYYGGVAYGFGYTGFGFEGGYWNGGHYFYNRSVNNITNVNITNVYNKTVIVNRTTVNHVSFSGGPGGVVASPTPQQLAAEHENHIQATPMQVQHVQTAQSNRALFASVNHGAPPVAATARPAEFNGPGVVRAQRLSSAPKAPNAGAQDLGAGRSYTARPAQTRAYPGALGESPATEPGSARQEGFKPEGYRDQPARASSEPHAPPQAAHAPPKPQFHPAPRPPAPHPQPPKPHPEPHDDHKHEG